MEEASRLDEAVFKEVILPLTAVNDTVLLGISTPLDENNFYSVMLDMRKPDGTKMFNVLEITLLCADCQAAGRVECPHKADLPAWKSGERQAQIALLMQNDRNLYIQENLGIVVRKDNAAFDKASITRFEQARVCIGDSNEVRYVYVAIDPCGGGPSEMALAAGFVTGSGTLVVAGSESRTVVSDASMEQMLVEFMGRLRRVNIFRAAHMVLIIERNFGGTVTAHRIAGICSMFQPVSALTGDSNAKLQRIGVVLDNDTKDRYRDGTAAMLRANILRMSDPYCSSDPDGARSTITKQLRNYRFELIERKAHGVPEPARKRWTGKTAGQNDDMAVAVQMLVFWSGVHQNEGGRCLVSC